MVPGTGNLYPGIESINMYLIKRVFIYYNIIYSVLPVYVHTTNRAVHAQTTEGHVCVECV
jgi:hypothetical protein